MNFPRRMTLQLTPLFDMLLIVIFAQYLEVRETQHTIQRQAGSAISELELTRAQLKALLAADEQLRIDQQTEQGRRIAAESELAAGQARLAQSQTDLDRVLEQQRVVAGLLTELFQIPPADVERLLVSARVPALEESPEDLARMQEKFRKLSVQRGGRMIEHLLTYDEIRKRSDVWNLHIDGKGIATITAGQRSTRLRIPTTASEDVDTDAFVAELYAWYRSLPQPKSLVVILLTYDRTATIAVMDAVRKALPLWVSRMQLDHPGQVRFEYADLGFRLE